MTSSVTLTISPVLTDKAGKKFACVEFVDNEKSAEGRIPECTITINKGFTPAELAELEDYMRRERINLQKAAAGTNAFTALMK